jgi:hypothetical protein
MGSGCGSRCFGMAVHQKPFVFRRIIRSVIFLEAETERLFQSG